MNRNTISTVGILGCGDFLRWMSGSIAGSRNIRVKSLYDPDPARASEYAALLGGQVAGSDEAIFGDAEIDTIYLFVPPWARRPLLERAVAAGKHVLTTKPLAATVADGAAMVRAVAGRVQCGVVYRRTGDAVFAAYGRLFQSGEIGQLALFKQDWIHHYPQWNTWATDPARNGGPFMDAMIHNLNIARFLMVRPPVACVFFSDNHVQRLPCSDTEFLKIDFEQNGSAHLFITWAADLAVHSVKGNDREHIDRQFLVSDQGWYLTDDRERPVPVIVGSRDGQVREWPAEPFEETVFDAFAGSVRDGASLRPDIPGIREAYEDIKILRDAEAHLGTGIPVDLSCP